MQQEDIRSVRYSPFFKSLTLRPVQLVVKLNSSGLESAEIQIPERLVFMNKLRTESRAC